MSTREQFFQSSAIKKPTMLPIWVASGTNVKIKTAAATTTNPNNSDFFTRIGVSGANTAITVADTYATIANITGAGNVTAFISPTHSASFTPTFRITVDGVVYIVTTSSALSASERLYIGAFTNEFSTAAAAGDNTYPGGADDVGWPDATSGGRPLNPSTTIALHPPTLAMSVGMPYVRFEQSLLVEVKASLLSATAVHRECAVAYALDV